VPPRAAIVVPTCNRPEVTRRCLQGILEQELTDFELVVIDDCSTDDTDAMLQQFAANHPNLRVDIFRNERNIGANPSRNRGIAATTAPLVCFLDCDSIPEPQWLRAILAPFDDHKVGAVNGIVVDVPPRNVFELTLKGNHRVHGTTHEKYNGRSNATNRRNSRKPVTTGGKTNGAMTRTLTSFATRPVVPANQTPSQYDGKA